MRDGEPTLLSTQKQVVMLRPATAVTRHGARPAFVIAVYNRSNRPVELRMAGITAAQTGLTANANPIHVYSYDELTAEVRRKQAWASVDGSSWGDGRGECRLYQYVWKLLRSRVRSRLLSDNGRHVLSHDV